MDVCNPQDATKTAKYRKRCFDQIEGIMAENKALIGVVDRLWIEAEKVVMEKAAQEEQMMDLSRRLADKDHEKRGDFMILDMWTSKDVNLILGRPFLNTINACIFIGSGKIQMTLC